MEILFGLAVVSMYGWHRYSKYRSIKAGQEEIVCRVAKKVWSKFDEGKAWQLFRSSLGKKKPRQLFFNFPELEK